LRSAPATLPHLQCKLRIGAVNDPLEAEADRVAERVMRMPNPAVIAPSGVPALRRKCAACEEEAGPRVRARVIGPADDPAEQEADAIAGAIMTGRVHAPVSRLAQDPIRAKGVDGGDCGSYGGSQLDEEKDGATTVQTKAESGSTRTNAVLSSRLDARHGSGQALPTALQRNFEQHLGVPLGGVQVHRDAEAGEMARSIGALAFTAGQDIYFASGRYAPTTADGAFLIAHEMVHVAQQRGDQTIAPIRRFTLKGFNTAQEAQMRAAVASAKTKMADCTGKGIPIHDIADILRGLDQADYVFDPDLDICGFSNPITDTIKVGPKTFDPQRCCDLDSTLAHECAHSFAWGFENFARKVECKCFGCSCS
jgi:hypothetical protein